MTFDTGDHAKLATRPEESVRWGGDSWDGGAPVQVDLGAAPAELERQLAAARRALEGGVSQAESEAAALVRHMRGAVSGVRRAFELGWGE